MGSKGPKTPNPAVTAAAQGQWNTFTAQQQQAMNMVNQNTPWGSLNNEVTGSTWMTDPSGKRVEVPSYTQTQTLSPSQQAIFDQTQAAELNLANVANEQSARIGDLLNNPFEFTNQDIANWSTDLAMQRIAPQQEQARKALETQLMNSGIRRGSSAWDSEMARMTNANTDQLNQLALTGRNQAFNEQLAIRNQPLNEIIGLMSGTQVQNPNATFAQSPQSQVAGVNYADIQKNYDAAELARSNAGIGALGGLFGSATNFFGRR